MLDAESKLLTASVAWSDSGKAFRISNVSDFATTILPKYFRTTKFSSFQRNLNLVRASCGRTIQVESERLGVLFNCAQSEGTVHLQSFLRPFFPLTQYGFAKVRGGPDSDMYAHASFFRDDPESLLSLRKMSSARKQPSTRPVSPSTSGNSIGSSEGLRAILPYKAIVLNAPKCLPSNVIFPRLPRMAAATHDVNPLQKVANDHRGRLDLLAYAMERHC
jgi:hypothetical protein